MPRNRSASASVIRARSIGTAEPSAVGIVRPLPSMPRRRLNRAASTSGMASDGSAKARITASGWP